MNYFKHEKALVDPEAIIGEGTRVWAFTHIQKGSTIGSDCNICNGSFIEQGAIIGNNVTIKHNVSVFNGVTIEDNVFVGSNIAFINDRHPRSHGKDDWILEKTLIKKGASLGANAVILCGITIGEYAFIGAGSVVTKNVAPHALVVGNPAQWKGYACHCGKKLNEKLACDCGHQYELKNKTLTLLHE